MRFAHIFSACCCCRIRSKGRAGGLGTDSVFGVLGPPPLGRGSDRRGRGELGSIQSSVAGPSAEALFQEARRPAGSIQAKKPRGISNVAWRASIDQEGAACAGVIAKNPREVTRAHRAPGTGYVRLVLPLE